MPACVPWQVGCVSGAQLSNYATFLAHPEQAPLSIVLTALSTAAGVVITPLLALALLGTRIPVDAAGMALSIAQIVLVPVAAGDPRTPQPLCPCTAPTLPGRCTGADRARLRVAEGLCREAPHSAVPRGGAGGCALAAAFLGVQKPLPV